MIVEQAGGRAITDDGRRILDIEPKNLHQRVPLIIGSKRDVDLAEKFLRGEM
jgi:fructose-1,6-bisphosphatase I